MAVIRGSLFRRRAVGFISPERAARRMEKKRGIGRVMDLIRAGKILGDVASPFVEGGIKMYEGLQVRDAKSTALDNVLMAREAFGRQLGDEWGDRWRGSGRDEWSPERDPNATAPFAREALQAGVAGYDRDADRKSALGQMEMMKRNAAWAKGGMVGPGPEAPDSPAGGTYDAEMFNKLGGTKGYLDMVGRETSGEPPARAWNLLSDEELAEREKFVEAALKERFDVYGFSDVAAAGADDSYGSTRNRMLQALRAGDEAGAQASLAQWEEGGHKGAGAKDVWERMSGGHIARARRGLQDIMMKFPTAQEKLETRMKAARELRRSELLEKAEKRAVAAEAQRVKTRPIDLETKKSNERIAFFKSGKWKAEWEQGFAKTSKELSELRQARTKSAQERAKMDRMDRKLKEWSLLSEKQRKELSWRKDVENLEIAKVNADWVLKHNRIKYQNALRQGKLQRKRLDAMDKAASATGIVDTYLAKQDFQKARSEAIAAERDYNKLSVKALERTAIIDAGRAPTRDIFKEKSIGKVNKWKTEGIKLAARVERARFRRDRTRKKELELRAMYAGLKGKHSTATRTPSQKYSSTAVQRILEVAERPDPSKGSDSYDD